MICSSQSLSACASRACASGQASACVVERVVGGFVTCVSQDQFGSVGESSEEGRQSQLESVIVLLLLPRLGLRK